jgi:hypothetical protein
VIKSLCLYLFFDTLTTGKQNHYSTDEFPCRVGAA